VAPVPRADLPGRWQAIAQSVRSWALVNPSLYALVYGSPVPGYAAPADTIGPATRVTRLLAALIQDSRRGEAVATEAAPRARELSAEAVEGLAPLVEFMGPGTTEEQAVAGLMVWTWLFGAVSFELFGQLVGAVAPERRDDVFAAEAERAAGWLGLTSA
jgi:hypothetical protein